mmetsp:Transcript_91443/g.158523  ORF Transcript_91443/g.158523 Transcript_91443/m.158523 type:complete len:331 (+) Transcript_91443:618-1610(+)
MACYFERITNCTLKKEVRDQLCTWRDQRNVGTCFSGGKIKTRRSQKCLAMNFGNQGVSKSILDNSQRDTKNYAALDRLYRLPGGTPQDPPFWRPNYVWSVFLQYLFRHPSAWLQSYTQKWRNALGLQPGQYIGLQIRTTKKGRMPGQRNTKRPASVEETVRLVQQMSNAAQTRHVFLTADLDTYETELAQALEASHLKVSRIPLIESLMTDMPIGACVEDHLDRLHAKRPTKDEGLFVNMIMHLMATAKLFINLGGGGMTVNIAALMHNHSTPLCCQFPIPIGPKHNYYGGWMFWQSGALDRRDRPGSRFSFDHSDRAEDGRSLNGTTPL